MVFKVSDSLRYDGLDLLAQPFRDAAFRVVKQIVDEGLPLMVWETFRDHRRQAAYYALGRTVRNADHTAARPMGTVVTKAHPGESAHEWGLALDMVLDIPGAHPWSHAPKHVPIWHRYAVIAKENGLVSGYLDWGWDRPHVEQKDWTRYRPEDWRELVALRLETHPGDFPER